jgi:Cu+-exporting ATPase
MALEPLDASAGTHGGDNAELKDMTRRFWIGAALALPVFDLAMAHMIPPLGRQPWVGGDVSRWIQFSLTTPVVCWAGWPFFSEAGVPSSVGISICSRSSRLVRVRRSSSAS